MRNIRSLVLGLLLVILSPLSWGEKAPLDNASAAAKPADTDCVWSLDGIFLMVKAEPKYPRKAKRKKITGFVKLEYDVSAIGMPENIRIIESEPAKTFDKAALDAVSKYRYKPRISNGSLVSVKNVVGRVDFAL